MPSSTSSSRPAPDAAGGLRKEPRRGIQGPLVFLAGFALMAVLVSALWRHTPLRRYESLAARALAPESADEYLGYSGSDFEHHIVYHGLENVAPPLRAADVLILGHSRTMYAFTRDFVERFEARTHLRCYVLGFGQGEQDIFPEAIIRKYDLHPRFVIANADNFFSGTTSAAARHALRYGRLPAMATRFEGVASHEVRRAIHRWLPHFACSEAPGLSDWVTYRSISDGTWTIAAYKGEAKAIPELEGPPEPPTPAALEAAERLNRMVAERGGRLVLTFVPSPLSDRPQVREIARRLGVPLIEPHLGTVMTLDGSHLDPESARRFQDAFLDQIAPYLPAAGR
jgi:hypothetical protein